MTDNVNPEDIERIVGVARSSWAHYGKADSREEKIYILHSGQCLNRYEDLRDCPFSLALDAGVDIEEWRLNVPLLLGVYNNRLSPLFMRD